MTVEATLNEINNFADAHNAAVIGRAFQTASIGCCKCMYPQSAESFHRWLGIYAQEKIELHHVTRKYNIHARCCDSYNRGYWPRGCDTCASFYKKELDLKKNSRITRRILREMWPCEDCIIRYNPTGRWKHPPTSEPEELEFVNVRFE
jgi:hypothetical protein